MYNIINALRAELLKTKRTAAIWVCVIGAAFIPVLFFIIYMARPDRMAPNINMDPWNNHFTEIFGGSGMFILPMTIIVASSLLMQIEVKNNAWKQLYTTPLSPTVVFISKLLMLIGMIIFFLLLCYFFILLVGLLTALFNSDYNFLRVWPNQSYIFKTLAWYFYFLLPVIALQYFLSLKFKNFIVGIGVGMALVIAGLILINWEKLYLFPYSYFSFFGSSMENDNFYSMPIFSSMIKWCAIYTFAILSIAYADNMLRKER
jgi:lantibiotic transport system permease protein